MLISNDERYIKDLIELWQDVFGDEKDYIKIFFNNAFQNCKCFVKIESGKVISCLYLLPCKLSFNNETFSGMYLYAAATAESFRKKGIMSSLIEEAKQYAFENSIDFISLVPAGDKLYNYYQKLGFITSMYKVKSFKKSDEKSIIKGEEVEADEILKARNSAKVNKFFWEKPEMSYALECLEYFGTKFYKYEDYYYLFNEKSGIIYELLFQEKTVISNLEFTNIEIYSSNELSGYENEKIPFGMIFPVNEKLNHEWKFDDIYMNLALD